LEGHDSEDFVFDVVGGGGGCGVGDCYAEGGEFDFGVHGGFDFDGADWSPGSASFLGGEGCGGFGGYLGVVVLGGGGLVEGGVGCW